MVYRLAIVMPPPPPILDDRKSRSIAFLDISDQYTVFLINVFTKWPPASILDDRKSLSITYFFSSQNGCRRPFWMTENHFRLHFSPFEINAQLFFFFTKWLSAVILDYRKSLSIAFFAISDQYTTFCFCFLKSDLPQKQ